MVELSGVLRTCIWSPWCYCSNTLLSVRDSAKYGFLLLVLICHNCGDTPRFHWVRDFFILPHYKIFPLSVGVLLLPNQWSGMHGIQNNWIIEIQFYFWFCPDLFKSILQSILHSDKYFELSWVFLQDFVKSTASILIRNNYPYLISNIYF